MYDPYSKGGVETAVKNITSAYANKGYEVIIITTGPYIGLKSLLPHKTVMDDMSVFRFYPLNIFWFFNIDSKPFWLRCFWHLIDTFNIHGCFVVRQILKQEKPDIVLTHGLKGISGLIPILLKILKRKHIHTVHDIQLIIPSGILIAGEEDGFKHNNTLINAYRLWARFSFSFIKTVIFPSKWLLDFYTQYGFFKQSNKLVLQNPIMIRQDSNTHTEKDNSVFNFIYIGQIETHKGILLLIDAFMEIYKNDKNKKIFLHIVGDGSDMNRLINATKDCNNIIIHGRKTNSEAMNLLTQAHLCIVPSLCYENAPMIITESINMRIPILASSIGGIPEMIQNHRAGFLFKTNNKTDLIEKMQYCLDHKLNS